jgi:hypothetical protein
MRFEKCDFHRIAYIFSTTSFCLLSFAGKDTSFIPPEGGRAAEASQSLFSHTDGKIRVGYGEDGCGRKVVGTERLILTQQSPYW